MYIPDHAARTSERRRLMSGVRYLLTSLRIQLISCSSAMGFCDILQGESVVPAIVLPCHGRKNMTRPSEADGSMRPIFRGLRYPGSTTCTPRLGATISLF